MVVSEMAAMQVLRPSKTKEEIGEWTLEWKCFKISNPLLSVAVCKIEFDLLTFELPLK